MRRSSIGTSYVSVCLEIAVVQSLSKKITENYRKLPMQAVFDELRSIMAAKVSSLDVKRDEPGDYYVDTYYVRQNKKPLWFGGVQIKKNYVSYHLMPVYVNPDLLNEISPALRKRMQGKSCFNFKVVDDMLFAELSDLTERGLRDYRAGGFV